MYPKQGGRRYQILPLPEGKEAKVAAMVALLSEHPPKPVELRLMAFSPVGRMHRELTLFMDDTPTQFESTDGTDDAGQPIPAEWFVFDARTPDGLTAKVSIATAGNPRESNWVLIGS